MNKTIETLLKRIEDAVDDLTTLEIKTLMGNMVMGSNEDITIPEGESVKGITSKIDLIDGDITTMINEEFYKNYPELVQWHQSREAKGNEIVESNILTVVKMISALRDNLFTE